MSYFRYYQDRKSNAIVVSLGLGDLLMESIKKTAEKLEIHTGIVLTGIGSLTKANFNYGGKTYDLDGPFEVTNLCGTIASFEPHIHISMVGADGKFYGGHLNDGCKIYTVAEISILKLDDLQLTRKLRDGSDINLLDNAYNPTGR